jgi:hypothetical protein
VLCGRQLVAAEPLQLVCIDGVDLAGGLISRTFDHQKLQNLHGADPSGRANSRILQVHTLRTKPILSIDAAIIALGREPQGGLSRIARRSYWRRLETTYRRSM